MQFVRCIGCMKSFDWAAQSNYYLVPGEPSKYAIIYSV